MRPKIVGFFVLVLAQLTLGQESESNALPWWPTQSGSVDNSINVKTLQPATQDDVTQQDTLANQGNIVLDLKKIYCSYHCDNCRYKK